MNEISLDVQRVGLQLLAIDAISLPPYKGSALRGGFGHSFRKVACAIKRKDCDDCLLKHRCAYSYIFETPPPADSDLMRKYPRVPHPFVIEPPLEEKSKYEPGERLDFGLVLIGRAREYLPYFVYAFDELGNMGIGRGKGRYRLEKITCSGAVIYMAKDKVLGACTDVARFTRSDSPVPRLGIRFLTPTRIKFEERLAAEPEFHILIRNLLRRISSLSYFHCGKQLDLDFNGVIDRAGKVRQVRSAVEWVDWERYSSRQDTRMKLGGFVGEVEYEGDLQEFVPLLKAGEAVHIGKATSFGLGKYQILTQLPTP